MSVQTTIDPSHLAPTSSYATTSHVSAQYACACLAEHSMHAHTGPTHHTFHSHAAAVCLHNMQDSPTEKQGLSSAGQEVCPVLEGKNMPNPQVLLPRAAHKAHHILQHGWLS